MRERTIINQVHDELLKTMLLDRGPLAEINYGDVPLHYNAGLPGGNKGIDWETGILLCNFVEQYKPKQIVELGTFRGYSAAWLIMGTLLAGGGRVDTFDVFPQGHYGSMWYKEYRLPLHDFYFHEVPGGIWKFPQLIPDEINLLFHDTEHLPGPTQTEMDILLPRVPVGGIVLIDDMMHPSYSPMQKVLSDTFLPPIDSFTAFTEAPQIAKHRNWSWSVLPFGHGLGIARRLK